MARYLTLEPPTGWLVVPSQPVGLDFPSNLDLPGLLKSDVALLLGGHSVRALTPCQSPCEALGVLVGSPRALVLPLE